MTLLDWFVYGTLFITFVTAWGFKITWQDAVKRALKAEEQATMLDHANQQLAQSLKTWMVGGGDFLTRLREANGSRQLEWDTSAGGITLSYRSNEMAGEAGELCNVIKKLERERLGIKGSRATVQDAADEGADVIICIDLIFKELGIDMAEAVRRKFNMTSEKVGLATRL